MPTATSETAPVPARREPTPDHPPYSWMIGEAIEALRGSATEEVISAFILGRHRGVPRAHDELLRHYLAKHVAQGLFVRTEEGRYSRGSRGTQQVTVAYHGRRRQLPELALVVANVGGEDDPTTAMDVDRDHTCTMAPMAADGTKHTSRRPGPCDAAPVHSPATASSDANVERMKKPRDRGCRHRKVQDLYGGRNVRVVLPPERVLPAASNAPAAGNEMWYVLALPAPGRKCG